MRGSGRPASPTARSSASSVAVSGWETGCRPEAVLNRVRHWAKVAGLPEADFGAHSLRSGFMTTAARRGKDLDSIMRTSRHRSERTARGYIERATTHERGAGEGLL